LPDNVSKEKIDAQYKDGVLELSLVKVGEAKKKALQIDIK
jgi:HSP20 family molecular chaperone IbpA